MIYKIGDIVDVMHPCGGRLKIERCTIKYSEMRADGHHWYGVKTLIEPSQSYEVTKDRIVLVSIVDNVKEFNIGDVVRIVACWPNNDKSEYIGETGVIVDKFTDSGYPGATNRLNYYLDFDEFYHWTAGELELVSRFDSKGAEELI